MVILAAKSTSALFGEVKRKKGFQLWDWQQSRWVLGVIVGRRVRWGLDSIGNWVPVVWVLGLDAPPCAVCVW